jgi:hypothetical protein
MKQSDLGKSLDPIVHTIFGQTRGRIVPEIMQKRRNTPISLVSCAASVSADGGCGVRKILGWGGTLDVEECILQFIASIRQPVDLSFENTY